MVHDRRIDDVRGLLAALLAWLAPLAAAAQLEEGNDPKTARPIDPRVAEVRFADDSRLKVMLADERIEIETAHGKLSVPAEEVRRIEFAPRLTDEERRQIEAWVEELGSEDSAKRAAAADKLLARPVASYPALVRAARLVESAVAIQAKKLLENLLETDPDVAQRARELDLVETEEAKIAGRIVLPALKIKTTQFGILEMKLADARSLRSLAYAELEPEEAPEPKNVQPDPGNLKAFESEIGKVYLFKVTGAAGGSLWGTGTYTTDSLLAAAAVHSGILKVGETGIVQVKIIPSPPSFAGSTQNGLVSAPYGPYSGAYEISKPKGKRRGN
jgi:hypothetical protein